MNTSTFLRITLAGVVFLSSALGAGATTPAPEYWPTCPSPQPIAPVTAMAVQEEALTGAESLAQRICDMPQNLTGAVPLQSGTSNPFGTVVAWDGSAYGAAWSAVSSGQLHIFFARVAADGTLLAGPNQVSSGSAIPYYPSLVWTGAEYGVAWDDIRNGDYDIYFARLDAGGSKIGSDIQVTTDPADQRYPSLVWTGTEYGVAWEDSRNPNTDIYFARLDATGYKIGGDVQVTSDPSYQNGPSLVWTDSEYGVAWTDSRNYATTGRDVYFARLDSAGVKIGGDHQITNDPEEQSYPSLAWTGTQYGVAWGDYRFANYDIYFARLDATGAKIGSDVQVTSDGSMQAIPNLLWTGAEFGVAWEDGRNGNWDIYFARLDSTGTKLGGDLAVSIAAGYDVFSFRCLAFGSKGYGLVWYLEVPGSVRFAGLGCHYDMTPPSCPMAPAEVSRTATPAQTVKLAWGPSQDYESEIARYVVTRNGVDVGTTADCTWTDPNFDAHAGYVYWVTALNAMGYASTGCTGSVDTSDHVPPTCPGNLMATSVTSSQVSLIWLAASDAKSGVWYYSVYRNGALLSLVYSPSRWYTDNTIAPNTTYNYAISAVDWAWNEQTACQSLWVSTKPITLMMTKNADGINANLDWTNVDINEYIVYRSPSPQTASELKRVPLNSATDSVLKDSVVLWYYYIQQRE